MIGYNMSIKVSLSNSGLIYLNCSQMLSTMDAINVSHSFGKILNSADFGRN